jgi:hypothetical protein
MMIAVRLRALVILAAGACAPAPPAPPSNVGATAAPPIDAAVALPADVILLVDRWTNCWHFRGEEAPPGDAQRAHEILDGIKRWCPGNDEERDRLRAVWHGRHDVETALTKLDELQ